MDARATRGGGGVRRRLREANRRAPFIRMPGRDHAIVHGVSERPLATRARRATERRLVSALGCLPVWLGTWSGRSVAPTASRFRVLSAGIFSLTTSLPSCSYSVHEAAT